MDLESILRDLEAGMALAVDVYGVEHIGMEPEAGMAVSVVDFASEEGPVTVRSEELTQRQAAELIGVLAQGCSLWSAWTYRDVGGLPVLPSVRYFALRPLRHLQWLQCPAGG